MSQGRISEEGAARLTVARRLAVLVATALSLLAAVGNLVWALGDLATGGSHGSAVAGFLSVPWVAGVSLVGLVLSVRRPNNGVGWVFVILGPLLGLVTVAGASGLAGPAGYGYGIEWLVTVSTFLVVVLAGPGLALVFPDGHLPSPRWRRPVVGAVGVFLISLALLAAVPGKLIELGAQNRPVRIDPAMGIAGLKPVEDVLTLGTFGGLFALCVLGVGAIVHRRRTGNAVVRAQLAWFLFAIALIPLGMLVSMMESAVTVDGSATAGPIVLFTGFSLVPVAVAIAILRYHLFDIDVVIRRTLSYAVVVATLAAIYAGSVIVLQPVVANVTGGQGIAVAGSTLLVAAAFQPLRRRVRRAVDRRFNRAGYDAELTVLTFAGRLRQQLDLDGVTSALAATATHTVQPSSISVWLRAR